MRRLLILTAFLAAWPAWSQAPGSLPTHVSVSPTRHAAENVLMGASGFVVGVASAALVGSTLDGAGAPPEVMSLAVLGVYPLGVATGVYGAGRTLGVDGSFTNALGDAAAGTAIGIGVGMAGLYVYSAVAPSEDTSFLYGSVTPPLGFVAAVTVAAGVAATVPVVWAVSDFRAAPVVLRSPDGETTPGLSLRVRF